MELCRRFVDAAAPLYAFLPLSAARRLLANRPEYWRWCKSSVNQVLSSVNQVLSSVNQMLCCRGWRVANLNDVTMTCGQCVQNNNDKNCVHKNIIIPSPKRTLGEWEGKWAGARTQVNNYLCTCLIYSVMLLIHQLLYYIRLTGCMDNRPGSVWQSQFWTSVWVLHTEEEGYSAETFVHNVQSRDWRDKNVCMIIPWCR
jgi:hypothetical protein